MQPADERGLFAALEQVADTRGRQGQRYPFSYNEERDVARVNAGIVGLCEQRDRELLAIWAWGVQWAAHHPEMHAHICLWDQGMLIWVLHRTKNTHLIDEDMTWTTPSFESPSLLV
jgi:hypothetical protein